MARLSKTTPFQIHNENGIPTPDSTYDSSLEGTVKEQELPRTPFTWAGGRKDDGFATESDEERKDGPADEMQEGNDERNYTRTSISSFPESSYPTDYEPTPMHKPYTPTYSRPSTRRMQMSSPLRKGRLGTPQSEPRGSPRSRRRDYDQDGDTHEPKRLPLVLLHITALPVELPWTMRSMREILPQHTIDNLQLLKSKLSDTVYKRGILIPHPREDYELLEEKLLETLELSEPRISKCGHYRARPSTDSTMTSGSTSSDSGVGSSVDESDGEHCSTCHHHLRAAGSGKQKWSIRVFAANGLMRASAWSAAWSEMERIDVEIMPWIKDDLRIKLDEKKTSELEVKVIDHEADDLRINQLVEERLRLLEEDTERARTAQMSREIEQIVINEQRQYSQSIREVPMAYIEASKLQRPVPESRSPSTELPNIYRPKDIPLSILLRNYIFLLARKPLNMAVFFLIVTIGGLLLSMGPAAMSGRLSELSTLVMATSTKTPLVESLPNIPLIENAPQAGFPALPESEVLVEDTIESVASPRNADAVTVSESDVVSEEENIAVLEPEAQPQETQPSVAQETPESETAEAILEVEAGHEEMSEGVPEAPAMQETPDLLPETAEAVLGVEADREEAPRGNPESQAVDVQETSDLLPKAAEAVSEKETDREEVSEGPDSPTVDMQETFDILPETAEAESEVGADREEMSKGVSETPVLDMQETSAVLPEIAEAVSEVGIVEDEEVLDEIPESPAVDAVVATSDSLVSSEEAGIAVSTPNQFEQEKEIDILQHDDDVEITMQADPVLDVMDDFVTTALSQAESPETSLPFSVLDASLPQCSVHVTDHEAVDTVS